MAPTEYRVHEAGIEVARQSTTVYIVGVASTKYKEGAPYIGIVLPCTCYWYIDVTSTCKYLYSHTQALSLASVVLASVTLH